MSALLIGDYIVTPAMARESGWRPVTQRAAWAWPPQGAESQGLREVASPQGAKVADPPASLEAVASRTGRVRLTDRGIAVVVAFFLAVCTTAALVLVSGFLAISNDPVAASPQSAVVGTQW